MKMIPIAEPTITQKEIDYVSDAMRSGWVSSLGPYIEKFEKHFAEFCGSKYAITVSNGTTGLHLALLSNGIKPGDEVIVPDLTFVATANAVCHAGATPVLVDIDKSTLQIDPVSIERALTPKTRAIIPVHLYGHPADMDAILKIANKHNLIVIEDAAEAVGADINSKKVGTFGNCGIFSFYGNKIITSGEGGMIVTDDAQINERARHLRDHAMSKTKRYWHDEVGYNYRMTNLQAALGLAQLDRIHEILDQKDRIFFQYHRQLSEIPGVRLNPIVKGKKNAHWMICFEHESFTYESREQFMVELKKRGIDSRPYFYPISDLPMYKTANTPNTHEISKKGVNLPSSFCLQENEIDFICKNVKEVLIDLPKTKQT